MKARLHVPPAFHSQACVACVERTWYIVEYSRESRRPFVGRSVSAMRLKLYCNRYGHFKDALVCSVNCVYRTRCPHAAPICSDRVPAWEAADGGTRWVACHRWRDLTA